jgi:hypothetical protein
VGWHGLAVLFEVRLGCFGCVVHGVLVVAAGEVSVMPGGFVPSCFVMLRRFLMMSSRVFMMFGCLVMMLCCFL